jgi:hypothetical protein
LAYAAAVTIDGPFISDGVRYWQLECAETDAAAASEWTFNSGVGAGGVITILSYIATHDSGTGTTVQPKLGTKTALAAIDTRLEFASAGAALSSVDRVTLATDDGDGLIYVRSTADAGTDNAQSTRICWCAGAI